MTYAAFLKWLLSLGPALPEIMASIQRIVVEVQFIREKLEWPETFQDAEPTAKEMALEQEVIAKAMGGAETFGGPLADLLAFIRANPELIAFLLKFFKK